MRRKRLNHIPNGIIAILDGYQIVSEFNYFDSYGAGRYEIDLINHTTSFNAIEIDPCSIFKFIHEWYWHEINQHKIDSTKIVKATILIEVSTTSWLTEHKQIRTVFGFPLFARQAFTTNVGYTGRIIVTLKTDEWDYSKTGLCHINI